MPAPRKGLTTGQPPQGKTGYGPYDEPGREASGPWQPPRAGDPHGYSDTIPAETSGARYGISVARPSAGGPTQIIPDAPSLIQSVHSKMGAHAPRQPSVERSPDGIRPAQAPVNFTAGMNDVLAASPDSDGDYDGDR